MSINCTIIIGSDKENFERKIETRILPINLKMCFEKANL